MAGNAEKIILELYFLISTDQSSNKGRFVRPFFYVGRSAWRWPRFQWRRAQSADKKMPAKPAKGEAVRPAPPAAIIPDGKSG
jgi:hypothetical protein